MGTLPSIDVLEHLQASRELSLLHCAAGLLWVHLLPAICIACPGRVLQLRFHAYEDRSWKLHILLSFHAE